jgi:glycosyltransferase involved in cell wall biosynthesis
MAKVSVIVPVYNEEKYLAECMDSILAQSLADIEIICVDDGSTDDSRKILDEYAVKDTRIKVLHRSNTGYGATMNAGLDMAKGEYIGIVESDDCVEPEMYEVLYRQAKKENLDIVKSDAFYWMESIGYLEKIHASGLDNYYDRVLCNDDRNRFFDFLMNIWTGIYRHEFLLENNIRFNETPGASYQDNGFWIQTLTFCKRAMWISRAFYKYRQDNPMSSVKRRDKLMDMTKEYEYVAQIMINRHNWQGVYYSNYFRMYRHRGTFLRIADEYKEEFADFVRKDYEIYKEFILNNGYLLNWCRQLYDNPQKVSCDVVQTKRYICDKLQNAESIIIYGAKRVGHIVLKGLYNEGFYNKIFCFAVSKNPQSDLIANKEVMLIQDAVRKVPNPTVIVAVTRGTASYVQMVATLHSLGVFDFIDGTDFEDNYYIL